VADDDVGAGLARDLGGMPAVWVNKAVCAALIAYGIWSARKKIIVDKGAATFVGYAKGSRHAEVFIKDIESVAWDAAKKDWELKAKQGILRIGLGRQSKAASELMQALKDRGVAVAEAQA